MSNTTDTPRIRPGSPKEIGRINAAIVRVASRKVSGRSSMNVLTTVARHRVLFRKWARYAGGLMPNGDLPRPFSELVILRVAHNCDCAYQWDHHTAIAQTVGLSSEDVARVRRGPDAEGWDASQAALLRATDELHGDRRISDATWSQLISFLSDTDLIELCLLVGHFETLAMTINSLGIQQEA